MIHAMWLASFLSAAPERLHEASRALDDLQYQVALDKLPAEKDVAGWRRDEVVERFSTRALALLGLKRDAEAAEAFRRLFSIAPEWVLPEQYGPRVRTFVSSANAQAARTGAISLRFEGGLIHVTKDGFGLAQELELAWREPGAPPQVATRPLEDRQPPPWPKGKSLEVWGRVRGLSGSTLAEWGSENAPTRLEPLEVLKVEGLPSHPLRVWGVAGLGAGAAGVLAAGLGAGFAVSSQGAEQALASVTRDGEGRITSLSQRAAFSLDARAADEAGAATAFFVTAAVLVATGAGLVLFDRLSLTPAPGGAVLTIPLDASFAFARLESRP